MDADRVKKHRNRKPSSTAHEKFLSKFKINEDTGCWEWSAGLNDKNGYGIFSQMQKRIYAHRYSYSFFIGEIADGLLVCHKCDNPKCCNPFHLFLGTNEDNMKDAKGKGRLVRVPHPNGTTYKQGCRCSECVEFMRDEWRRADIRKKIKKGINVQRT